MDPLDVWQPHHPESKASPIGELARSHKGRLRSDFSSALQRRHNRPKQVKGTCLASCGLFLFYNMQSISLQLDGDRNYFVSEGPHISTAKSCLYHETSGTSARSWAMLITLPQRQLDSIGDSKPVVCISLTRLLRTNPHATSRPVKEAAQG